MFNEKKNFFTLNKGKNTLSMSDAQTISNMCNQKAQTISRKLDKINNFEKVLDLSTVKDSDNDSKKLIKVKAEPLNHDEVCDLLEKQSKYYSLQGFLVSHITLKESMLENLRREQDDFEYQSFGDYCNDNSLIEKPSLDNFTEYNIWETISPNEILRYYVAETDAATIGKFIHKDSKLDKLRKQLSAIPEYEFEEFPDGRVAIIEIKKHHTDEDLEKTHIVLADKHRDSERVVNSFKARLKNDLRELTDEARSNYNKEREKYNNQVASLKEKYDAERTTAYNIFLNEISEKTKEVANSRIEVPEIFSSILEEFNVQK